MLIWMVLAVVYFSALFLFVPEIRLIYFSDSVNGEELYVGFWNSCMESYQRIDQGPEGSISPALNQAAARYVSTVYGHGELPNSVRKSWAISLASLVMSTYGLCIALFTGTSLSVLATTIFFAILAGVLCCVLFLYSIRKKRFRKIPLSHKIHAQSEIRKMYRDASFKSEIDEVFQKVGTSSFLWWPYPQGKGRLFLTMMKVIAITIPFSYAVMEYFQQASPHNLFVDHHIVLTTILLLALATEWMLLVVALVWFGDWQGASRSTRVTFPLRILLNDIADLTC